MATTKKADGEAKKPAISYWSKDKCQCPVCKKFFEREIMRSGNGRMIAGGLSEELHRTFEPSAKYGRVYPLIYEVGACPNCYSFLPFLSFLSSALLLHYNIEFLTAKSLFLQYFCLI